MPPTGRPTRAEREAERDRVSPTRRFARHDVLPDVLPGPGDPPLRVLFCGINPGLWSAATGHHFARPGNRFWPTLAAAGFTPRRFRPDEQHLLPSLGLGLTNVAPRATARADELTTEELVAGGERLRALVRRVAPSRLAVVGLGAYRVAFADPGATVGPREATIGGTQRSGAAARDAEHRGTGVWVLPNPSGLNAHHSAADLAAAFARLREAARE